MVSLGSCFIIIFCFDEASQMIRICVFLSFQAVYSKLNFLWFRKQINISTLSYGKTQKTWKGRFNIKQQFNIKCSFGFSNIFCNITQNGDFYYQMRSQKSVNCLILLLTVKLVKFNKIDKNCISNNWEIQQIYILCLCLNFIPFS